MLAAPAVRLEIQQLATELNALYAELSENYQKDKGGKGIPLA